MRKFSVTDLTTGTVTQTNGVQAPTNGILMSQIDYQTSADGNNGRQRHEFHPWRGGEHDHHGDRQSGPDR
jgi:hypothetical protein